MNIYEPLLRPFFLMFMLLVFGYPAKRLVQKYMKDGKLKRLLLRRVG
jgi:hypothetical protein